MKSSTDGVRAPPDHVTPKVPPLFSVAMRIKPLIHESLIHCQSTAMLHFLQELSLGSRAFLSNCLSLASLIKVIQSSPHLSAPAMSFYGQGGVGSLQGAITPLNFSKYVYPTLPHGYLDLQKHVKHFFFLLLVLNVRGKSRLWALNPCYA